MKIVFSLQLAIAETMESAIQLMVYVNVPLVLLELSVMNVNYLVTF